MKPQSTDARDPVSAPDGTAGDSAWSVTLGSATRSIGIAEDTTDEAWAEFERLKAAGLDAFPRLSVADVKAPVTAEEMLDFWAASGKHCLRPGPWSVLYRELVSHIAITQKPPPPIPDALWGKTSLQVKQMCFEEHVRWAERNGLLARFWVIASKFEVRDWWSPNAHAPSRSKRPPV